MFVCGLVVGYYDCASSQDEIEISLNTNSFSHLFLWHL